jgi:hypothetical protein
VSEVEILRVVDLEVDADVRVYRLTGAGAVARALLK